MKVLTILGSPRKRGNTGTILQAFEKIISNHHTIERINVTDLTINGCLGCEYCQKSDADPSCIQKDDMQLVLSKIIESDVVVYASPVYAWDFSAQMKLIIDRQYALVKWKNYNEKSLVQGKRALLLTTCGGDTENNADLIMEIFEREIKYLKGRTIGKFAIGNCSVPKALGNRAETVAGEMAIAIEKSVSDTI